jgi:hypothetical protein
VDARPWLESLETDPQDPTPSLAFLAAQEVDLDPAELHAARRRGLLLLAAGGDPQRELDVEGRAVASVAADLDDADRRHALADALARLEEQSGGLPRVAAALARLRADADGAWRWLACALLAEELAAG